MRTFFFILLFSIPRYERARPLANISGHRLVGGNNIIKTVNVQKELVAVTKVMLTVSFSTSAVKVPSSRE